MNEDKTQNSISIAQTSAENWRGSAQSHMIDLPAGRFHYLSWGIEHTERPSALLLHGVTSSAWSWVRVGPALADRYRVYALDMRGHGESIAPPAGTYNLRQVADDAAAFIEALELENPIVIGHSWGGMTAIVLASGANSEKPAPRFSKIILEDPAYNFGRYNPVEHANSYTGDIGRPADEVRAELYANNPGWTFADVEGKIDALQKITREAVVSVFVDGSKMGNVLPLLTRLADTALLMRADPNLSGTLDDSAWEEAKRYLPSHSRVIQIDGASHNIHRSKFEEFMQTVNDFLK